MSLFDKIHPTRFKQLGFVQLDANTWQFVDLLSDPKKPAQVGQWYRTKGELLADTDRYYHESWSGATATGYGKGHPIQLVSGRMFYPLSPEAADIHIADIAHALSRICRFGGHVSSAHYSVAQHSYLVSTICDPADALAGLLHDAAEAYVGDLVRPLKAVLPGFAAIEAGVHRAIAARFSIPEEMPASVVRADNILLATECRDLMGGERGGSWGLTEEPMGELVRAWGREKAEMVFMRRFEELTNR